MPFSLNRAALWLIRACPVTTAVLVLAIALTTGEAMYRFTMPEPDGSRHALGGVVPLQYTQEPQLHGPLALWEGQWWRVPVNAFHHGGTGGRPLDPLQWLHLGLNCLALVYLGALLEPRLRRIVYFVFVLGAIVAPLLAEFLLDHYAFGLSGLAYALFGALLVLRRGDREVADALPPPVIWLGIAWLIACVPLTVLEILPVANVAHFTGLAWGWVAGQAFFSRAGSMRWRVAFVAGHLLLVPGFYFVVHPVWNGRYHWRLAFVETDPQRQVGLWEQAVARDPGLETVWLQLARHHEQRGAPLEAWRTILAALDANRTFDRGDQYARRLWRTLRSDEERRKAAWQILAQQFGPEEPAWRERLGISPAHESLVDADLPGAVASRARAGQPDLSRYRLDQRIELAPGPRATAAPRDLTAPGVDPDDPASAALGRGL